ncbi:glycosyltransferase [Candidatus Pelagibacter bacterium nBUS_30]|uniref:glycosyltransferase n=1 Tax=Candidatus Pelagibacter bacterium nBUS_30 TaxID=3374191 RepID=UPI003EBF907F
MKKIIFFMPNIERGGIEKNLILLSMYFINKDYGVEIIFSKISKNIKNQLDKRIKLNKSKNFIKKKFFSERIINSINSFINLISLNTKGKPIVISMQDHPFAIVASKKLNLKCILRIANHPGNSIKFFNKFYKFKFKLFIKLFFYKFANGIICNSKSSASYLKSKTNNKNITSIYNPISLDKNNKKFRRKNYLLTVGRLENQKNIKGIILAFKKIEKNYPKFKLVIVGSGREEIELKELVKTNNISQKVKFIKFKNPKKYYKESKLFILNSLWEGLPNVLIESLNYNLPIVSTDCESGPKEILLNGKYGFLTQVDSPLLLSRKISFVLNNYKLAEKKTSLGFQSLKRFDITSQCQKYEKFIHKII